VPQCCREIAKRENEADKTTREVLTALRRTFITPLDRGDIKDLITSMDDAIAQMNQTAKLAAGQRPFAAEEADDRAHGVSPSGATAWRSERGDAQLAHLSDVLLPRSVRRFSTGAEDTLLLVLKMRPWRRWLARGNYWPESVPSGLTGRCAQPAALDYGLGAQGGLQSMAERLKEAVLGVTKIPENLARAA
jgi:Protein of unknown function DUF47